MLFILVFEFPLVFVGKLIDEFSNLHSLSVSSVTLSKLSSSSVQRSEYISLSGLTKSLSLGGGTALDLTDPDSSLIGENVSAVGVFSSNKILATVKSSDDDFNECYNVLLIS